MELSLSIDAAVWAGCLFRGEVRQKSAIYRLWRCRLCDATIVVLKEDNRMPASAQQ
jgi:hypothetical protein